MYDKDYLFTVIFIILLFILLFVGAYYEYMCVSKYFPDMNFLQWLFLDDKIMIIPRQ